MSENAHIHIKLTGTYSKHIALFLKLLHLDNVSSFFTNNDITSDLRNYYKNVSLIVKKETRYDIAPNVFEFVELKNDDVSMQNVVEIDCSESITQSENNFISSIKDLIDLTPDHYVKSSIEHIIKRNSNSAELQYHSFHHSVNGINCFTWICILNACEESAKLGYREFFVDAFRTLPKCRPRIAVLMCGYLRNYKYSSHLQLLNSPYVDVFIHTWDDHGFKNERRLIDKSWLSNVKTPINVETIVKQYRPVKMKVETNSELLDSFSLLGKVHPLFLYSGQAKDDASKYINSQLYSIWAAYNLMRDHENEKGFEYDAIIRLRFDFNITHLDWSGIVEDINKNSIYFPDACTNGHKHSGGGGGCISCDRDLQHDKHTNDLCDIWFYGRRDLACQACELFLQSEKIMKEHHDENMKALRECNGRYSITKEGYVYISSTKDIETTFVAMYPERLLREELHHIPCKSSRRICGRIS